MPKNPMPTSGKEEYDDLAKFSDLALAELQLSPSDWHARRARVILQGRAVNGIYQRRQ